MTLKGTPEQAQTRLLLALWELGAAPDAIKKGDLTKKVVRKGERAGDYQALLAELQDKGAIAMTTGNRVLITPQPEPLKHLLVQALQANEFEFKANIGKNLANALLSLIRQMGHPTTTTTAPVPAANGHRQTAIASYEEFKTTALQVYDTLNRDFNMDNLVPIYRIRREIGDRVSRSQFSTWLFEMQTKDILELSEEGIEDGAPDKLQDSVTTKLGKLRCYAKRLA